jgi:chitinase
MGPVFATCPRRRGAFVLLLMLTSCGANSGGTSGTHSTGGTRGSGGTGGAGGEMIPADGGPSDAPDTDTSAADAGGSDGIGGVDGDGATGRRLLAVYWGQNSYGATHPDMTTWERPLAETCAGHPEYDFVILSFATQLAHTRNQPFVPETNFANHCGTSYDAANPFLLRCNAIATGVGACQAAGKRVLLSIGGGTGSTGFLSDADGQQSAQAVWDIFLGGQSSIRPFSGATLDGVDLDIEGGGSIGTVTFVRTLRALMDQSGRKYWITGAPQCPYPDAFLGPAAGRALGDAPEAFDYVFIQFYNNYCGYGSPAAFRDTFAQWKTLAVGGPKILVGLPASVGAAGSGYVLRTTLPALLDDVKADPAFAGVMLWDASSDDNSVEGGMGYGAYIKSLLP